MWKKMLILVVGVLLCSSPAWAVTEYIELYCWDFDTTGDAQNWNLNYGSQAPDPQGYQTDTYDGTTNFVNLGGAYNVPPNTVNDPDPPSANRLWLQEGNTTIPPATSGGALGLVHCGDFGYYELYGFKIERGLAANEDVMKVQFNTTTLSPATEHSQGWLDWYIRAPEAPWDWARMRTKPPEAGGLKGLVFRGDVQDGEWSRTTFDVADIEAGELIAGTKWWAPGELENLNGVFAVNFVMNIFPGEEPAGHFVDDIRLIGTPEPATIALLGLGGLALLRRRK